MNTAEKQRLYEYHKKNSELIENERIEQQRSFDSWLLKLCGGSFAVSFAFIEKLVNLRSAVFKPLLICGWLCFSLCLCLCVYAFFNTQKACYFAFLQEWDKYRNETENAGIELKPNRRNIVAKFLNSFCLILFIAGVLCLLLFLSLNI